jgi:hypothetical protein
MVLSIAIFFNAMKKNAMMGLITGYFQEEAMGL